MSSPEIKKTDTEVVIKYPKHSDLDIKFYNPEIFHSLGFKNVTIHLDTLESGESEETASIYGGGLLDYEPTPEQPIETLSYPYRYFAYMFRTFNPSAKSEGWSSSNGVNNKPGDIEPKGLMSSIMGLADVSSNNKPQTQSPNGQPSVNPEPEQQQEVEKEKEKENGFFSMFVNKNKQAATNKKEPSIIDNLFPAQTPVEEKTPEQKEPSIKDHPSQVGRAFVMDSLFPAQPPVEEKTPEQKEPSIMDSLFPAQPPVEEKTPEPEQKEPSIKDHPSQVGRAFVTDSLLPVEQPPTQTQLEEKAEEKTPQPEQSIKDHPSQVGRAFVMDSLFPVAKSDQEPVTQPQVATPTQTPDAVVTSLPATEPEPAPVVPFAPITTPFSANWVIHVPIVDNNSPQDAGGDMPTKDNELFDDVLLFSEIEAKNGIYVRGNFVEILGRKIKIGVVEQLSSGENMRTIKEYLSNGRPLLEGTRMQKYSLLFSS